MSLESTSSFAEVRPKRGLRRMVVMSFAMTLAVFGATMGFVLHNANAVFTSPCTTSFSLTSPGTYGWDTAPWSPPTASSHVPGTASGDCVFVGSGVEVTLTSAASLGDVSLSATGSFGPQAKVLVGSGGSLTQTAGLLSNNGTLQADSGGTIQIGTGSSQTNAGSLAVNGGTLSINDPLTVNSLGNLTMHGGTLNGSGSLTVSSGTINFDGSQGPMTVAMTNPINVNGTGNYNSTNTSAFLTLNTRLNVNGNSTFYLNADAELNGTGPIVISSDTTGSGSNGSMNKTSGFGDSVVNAPLNNHGTVAVTGSFGGIGGIVLAGGGTHDGYFSSFSSSITFSGNHNLESGCDISAPANVTGAGTVINVNAPVSMQSLYWDQGTIAGTGLLTLNNSSTFDLGLNPLTLNGSILGKQIDITSGNFVLLGANSDPTANLIIPIGGSNPFNMGGSALLETHTTQGEIDLIGNVEIPATTGIIRVDSGAYLGTSDPSNPFDQVTSAPPSNGLPPRLDGKARARTTTIETPQPETKAAPVGGRRRATTPGNARASSTAMPAGPTIGAFLDLNGGNVQINSTNPLFLKGGGQATATSYIQFIAPTPHQLHFSGGAFTLNNPNPIGSFASINDIVIDGGDVTFAGNPTTIVDNFTLVSGEFSGPDVSLNSGMAWQGGKIGDNSGHTTVRIPLNYAIDATGLTSAATLHDATIELTGNFEFDLSTQAMTFENASIVHVQAGAFMNASGDGDLYAGIGGGAINNDGTLQKTGGTSGTRFHVVVNNTNAVSSEAGGGNLILMGGGTMTGGTMSTSTATDTIDFAGGIYNITGGALNGAGVYRIAGLGELDVNTPSPLAITNLTQMSGTLGGAAEADVANLIWQGGTMNGGGITQVGTSASITGTSTPILTNRTFKNPSTTIAYAPVNPLDIRAGGVLNNGNTATFDLQNANGILATVAGGQINNFGLFKKSSSGTSRIDPLFNSVVGNIHVSAGTLKFNGGGSASAGITNTATLEFSGGNFAINPPAAPSMTGSAALVVSGGSLASGVNIAVPSFTLSGGTFTGNGNLDIGTSGTWTGGTMSGSGTTTVTGPASMVVTGGASNMTLDARQLVNNGTIMYTAATNGLTMSNGASINNASGAFTISGDAPISGGSIVNSGTFEKTSGTLTDLPSISNSALVNAQAGTMRFTGYTQNTGNTRLAGGAITVTPGTMQLNGGVLIGAGAVNAAVANAGASVSPGIGTTTGIITINGVYSQSAGQMNIDLGGATPGTYDQVISTVGTTNVTGGVFSAIYINGFTPASGNTFDVFKFPAKTPGDFASKNLPAFPNGVMTATYLPTVSPTRLQLAAVATADMGITQTAPGSVAQGSVATITLNVNNVGANPATNVSVIDTFGGGAFSSATPSQGTCSGTGPITCNLGAIPGGGSATISIGITANAPGSITNSATVSESETDTNTANNTTNTATITVTPVNDVRIAKSGTTSAIAGGTVTYTVTVTNDGPSTATGITVSDPTPSGLTFVSNTGACTNAYPCNIASLASTASATITSTYTVNGGATGTITNTASVAAANDPNNGNNSASANTLVGSATDVGVTKSGPGSASPGDTISYNIAVKNVGTTAATGVTLSDPTPPRLTLVSVSGACSAFPCNIGTLNANQTVNVAATYTVTIGGPANTTNTATVSATGDSITTNNTASVTTAIGCSSTAPQLVFPNTIGVPTSGTLQWSNTNASSYKVYLGVAGTGCSTLFGTTSSTTLSYSNLQANTQYEWRVETNTPGCVPVSSTCGRFTTGSSCPAAPPTLLSPANAATIASPVKFQWSTVEGATQYQLFIASNGAAATSVATVTTNSAEANVDDGPGIWFVVATLPCGVLQSQAFTFNGCNTPVAPAVGVVAESVSGLGYIVQWPAIAGATKYEIEEANNPAFANSTTQTVNAVAGQTLVTVPFVKTTGNTVSPFYYRVRVFSGCAQQFGPNSIVVRVVIAPLPSPTAKNTNINLPVGSQQTVTQQIFIPGLPDGNYTFSATSDAPWVTVTPSSGILTPNGVTLSATFNPANLPNGTFTSTIIVILNPVTSSSSNASPSVSTVVSQPVSVTLVTPVTPTANSATPAGALIIPSVGHLDGVSSKWQSDIRVTNAGFSKQQYSLTYTPDDPAKGAKSTQITIDSGGTTALDDIVRNWYGVGQLGETQSGVLEIHPVAATGSPKPLADPPSQSLTTVASSRTYNVTTQGTLGQYVPAVPLASFISKTAGTALGTVLSLQQVAQSASFRTNFGVVEGSGKPVSVTLSVFDTSGQKLKDIGLDLKAFEQKQLNSMLAVNGITNLSDGRVEVKVNSGDGKVTAYASVIDNFTQDPLLVSGVALNQILSNKFVLPGVASINNGLANWRTDMRIFNSGTTAQNATLTLYPLTGSGNGPIVKTTSINPGEVKTIDDAMQTLFGQANLGGAVHVTTTTDSSLIVSGRTYNKTELGTYGQFIGAVTPNEGIGNGARALQILQVEESPRYRTNVGLAEVSGKPVTVEVSVILPDSRVTPKLRYELGANEYRQDAILAQLGVGNVYNARVTVTVVGGEGKITAYGSVIDKITQDPTYVPAQ